MADRMQKENWQVALLNQRVFIEGHLSLSTLFDHMIQGRILTIDDVEDIKKAKTCRLSQVERFLDVLLRKRISQYERFTRCLTSCGFDFIVRRLSEVPNNPDDGQPHWKTVLTSERVFLSQCLDVCCLQANLLQEKIVTSNEMEAILHEPDPSTRYNRMGFLLNYLERQSEDVFSVFLECIKKDYRFLYDEIQQEKRRLEEENDQDRRPFWKSSLIETRDSLQETLNIVDLQARLIQSRVITSDQYDEFTAEGRRGLVVQIRALLDHLQRRTKRDFDNFLIYLDRSENEHVKKKIKQELESLENLRCPIQASPDADAVLSDNFNQLSLGPNDNPDGGSHTGGQVGGDCVDVGPDQGEVAKPFTGMSDEERRKHYLNLSDQTGEPPQGTGFTVRFKIRGRIGPDIKRRFCNTSIIENVMNFVGAQEGSTETFNLRINYHPETFDISSNADHQTLQKTLQECKITDGTIFYVQWHTRDGNAHESITSTTAATGTHQNLDMQRN